MIYKSKLKRRKLYYIPGLISLIFLPIIFLKTLHSNKPFPVLNYAVLINVKESNMPTFSGQYFMKQIKRRKLIPFYLDESHEVNKNKFSFIQREALRLKYTCDTNYVIAVHLSDSLNYGEFVYLLNMMVIGNHKRYAEWKNIFYIFGEEPPDPENEIEPIYL